ncbi:MAG: potassium channel family protein [Gemmatimonadaceae bacterium]|nr:potassium channel family protein [Gemmatimonadaceae bacterium]
MRTILVGSGHLAHRIRTLISASGGEIVSLSREHVRPTSEGEPTFESIVRMVRDAGHGGIASAYLVDDRDEVNLEFLIALMSVDRRLPVVVALFNENIAPHLQAANPNVRVLNPAKIAAPAFVDALDAPLTHALGYRPVRIADDRIRKPVDPLIMKLSLGFVSMLVAATAYFHAAQQLSWIDALYFVTVTVATVGYGDINLLNASTVSKLMDIGLILGSTVFIWMIFSLTVDRIIKRRVQLALGRRTYTIRDHVIVCGLGRLGYFIAEGLLARGEHVLIVERNEDSSTIEHFRSLGADVYIGDARLPRVLKEVGVTRAKALYSVINNDFVNLEIGLNARTFEPNLRLVLRIYDDAMSARIREQLDIHLIFSMTAIADEKVFRAMPSVAAATAP